jgi:hypothetical protein
MMEPTRGNFTMSDVSYFNRLDKSLRAMSRMNHERQVEALSDILMNGHKGRSEYMTFGNNKIASNTGIFNINSATDCPNADSTEDDQSETGVCQVPWKSCYAHKAENIYPNSLGSRRLQQHLWDSVDAVTFAEALLRVKERKRSDFTYLRINESGDFRDRSDIIKLDRIAEIVSPEIDVYTYSASHKLDWSYAEHFTVNQSNNLADYGDRLFSAVPTESDIPEDAIMCPFEAAKNNGVETDNRPKCGECEACIKPESEQPRSVYITIH